MPTTAPHPAWTDLTTAPDFVLEECAAILRRADSVKVLHEEKGLDLTVASGLASAWDESACHCGGTCSPCQSEPVDEAGILRKIAKKVIKTGAKVGVKAAKTGVKLGVKATGKVASQVINRRRKKAVGEGWGAPGDLVEGLEAELDYLTRALMRAPSRERSRWWGMVSNALDDALAAVRSGDEGRALALMQQAVDAGISAPLGYPSGETTLDAVLTVNDMLPASMRRRIKLESVGWGAPGARGLVEVDVQTRELERRAATGDPDAERRLKAMRMRSGEDYYDEAELAKRPREWNLVLRRWRRGQWSYSLTNPVGGGSGGNTSQRSVKAAINYAIGPGGTRVLWRGAWPDPNGKLWVIVVQDDKVKKTYWLDVPAMLESVGWGTLDALTEAAPPNGRQALDVLLQGDPHSVEIHPIGWSTGIGVTGKYRKAAAQRDKVKQAAERNGWPELSSLDIKWPQSWILTIPVKRGTERGAATTFNAQGKLVPYVKPKPRPVARIARSDAEKFARDNDGRTSVRGNSLTAKFRYADDADAFEAEVINAGGDAERHSDVLVIVPIGPGSTPKAKPAPVKPKTAPPRRPRMPPTPPRGFKMDYVLKVGGEFLVIKQKSTRRREVSFTPRRDEASRFTKLDAERVREILLDPAKAKKQGYKLSTGAPWNPSLLVGTIQVAEGVGWGAPGTLVEADERLRELERAHRADPTDTAVAAAYFARLWRTQPGDWKTAEGYRRYVLNPDGKKMPSDIWLKDVARGAAKYLRQSAKFFVRAAEASQRTIDATEDPYHNLPSRYYNDVDIGNRMAKAAKSMAARLSRWALPRESVDGKRLVGDKLSDRLTPFPDVARNLDTRPTAGFSHASRIVRHAASILREVASAVERRHGRRAGDKAYAVVSALDYLASGASNMAEPYSTSGSHSDKWGTPLQTPKLLEARMDVDTKTRAAAQRKAKSGDALLRTSGKLFGGLHGRVLDAYASADEHPDRHDADDRNGFVTAQTAWQDGKRWVARGTWYPVSILRSLASGLMQMSSAWKSHHRGLADKFAKMAREVHDHALEWDLAYLASGSVDTDPIGGDLYRNMAQVRGLPKVKPYVKPRAKKGDWPKLVKETHAMLSTFPRVKSVAVDDTDGSEFILRVIGPMGPFSSKEGGNKILRFFKQQGAKVRKVSTTRYADLPGWTVRWGRGFDGDRVYLTRT